MIKLITSDGYLLWVPEIILNHSKYIKKLIATTDGGLIELEFSLETVENLCLYLAEIDKEDYMSSRGINFTFSKTTFADLFILINEWICPVEKDIVRHFILYNFCDSDLHNDKYMEYIRMYSKDIYDEYTEDIS